MTTKISRQFGRIRLKTVLWILLAPILLLGALAILYSSVEIERKTACLSNLRRIEQAKNFLANNGTNSAAAEAYAGQKTFLRQVKCPSGGHYTFNPIKDRPTCTIPGHVLPERIRLKP